MSSASPPISSVSGLVNVADRLAARAQQAPEAIAVAVPGPGDLAGRHPYQTCTFAELEQDATALARGLVTLGVRPGTRIVLLVKPGLEFVKLVFALLRSGATTILIDPGMGRPHLVECLAAVDPEGFVAISPAQAVRTLLRRRFPRAKVNVTVGRRWFWGGQTYAQLLALGQRSQTPLPVTEASAAAAIIYTSGSTGPPKGVLYTHQMFDTQVEAIGRHYRLQPGSVDLACFPLFGLFNAALGITTVFPDMDFSRPAAADPKKLLDAAHDWQVTQAFASPAVWDRLSQYCSQHEEQIPTLRNVFSCGAPVPATVLARTLACVADGAQMHTPYGATESLPIASIEAAEVLAETSTQTDRGAGVCVGRKFDSIEWRVIRITDAPIRSIEESESLPTGAIGELIVRGPQVSPQYVAAPNAPLTTQNALSKIADGDTVWHRLGDVGYFDDQQRFWYCGRKAHRVETAEGPLFTIPIEGVVNAYPNVRRSALVGVGEPGQQTPVVLVEFQLQANLEECFAFEQLARSNPRLQPVRAFAPSTDFPVDVRHNSKIRRECLVAEATTYLATCPITDQAPRVTDDERLATDH